MKTLLVIPARGGSKGIPRKNLQMLQGEPLISYSIRAALRSRSEQVIVSTDDEEIREVAISYGAQVPFLRPAQLSGDEVSLIPVLQHAVEIMQKLHGPIQWVCCLQPSAPLISPETVNRCLEILHTENCDSVVTVRQVLHNHALRSYSLLADGRLSPLFPEGQTFLQRQELPTLFALTGGFYARKSSLVTEWSGRDFALGENCKGVVVSDSESLNIDAPIDLEFADFLISRRSLTASA